MMKQPLLDKSQTDQALRDLMPTIEWLTQADLVREDGFSDKTFVKYLKHAYEAFCDIPGTSPAIKAYIRWLEQNTVQQDAEQDAE
jgi:hypothetical protein